MSMKISSDWSLLDPSLIKMEKEKNLNNQELMLTIAGFACMTLGMLALAFISARMPGAHNALGLKIMSLSLFIAGGTFLISVLAGKILNLILDEEKHKSPQPSIN